MQTQTDPITISAVSVSLENEIKLASTRIAVKVIEMTTNKSLTDGTMYNKFMPQLKKIYLSNQGETIKSPMKEKTYKQKLIMTPPCPKQNEISLTMVFL